MIMFFMVYLYRTPRFLHKINSYGIKIKKLRLDGTCSAKLKSIWNPIFTIN